MAKKKSMNSASRAGTSNGRAKRLRLIGQNSSQIVRDAARLLDEDLAAGIIAAKQVQGRLHNGKRINPSDFQAALKRLRDDGHAVVGILDEQMTAVRSRENAEVVNRLLENTRNLLDLIVEAVNTGATVANQFVNATEPTGRVRRGKRTSR
jgi:hypothetical protein